MSEADSGKADAAFCAQLVRDHDFARYASTLFVGAEQRRSLLALFAFNAEIARVSEQVSQPLPGEIRLQWWSDMLSGKAHGGIDGNPVAAELQRAVARHDLPVTRLIRLIEEHQFDLYDEAMPSMAALEAYCQDTAATLFALAARVVGGDVHTSLDMLAREAGLALGFIRVLKSLPYDVARRRCFVPVELLHRHDSDVAQLFAAKETPGLRHALDELVVAARAHLRSAFAQLERQPQVVQRAFLPLALVQRDLRYLRRADAEMLTPQRTARVRTLWTLWRASKQPLFGG